MRSCGECTACCTVMGVRTHPEKPKRAYEKCDKLCAGGCSIYATKPDECTTFQCEWLGIPAEHERYVRDEERPDKCGIVLTMIGTNVDVDEFKRRYGLFPLQAFEVWPGAASTYRAQKLLNRIRRRMIIAVCLYDSTERYCIGPDGYDQRKLDRLGAMATRNAELEEQWHKLNEAEQRKAEALGRELTRSKSCDTITPANEGAGNDRGNVPEQNVGGILDRGPQ